MLNKFKHVIYPMDNQFIGICYVFLIFSKYLIPIFFK